MGHIKLMRHGSWKGARRITERNSRADIVRIEVEERVALMTHKVIRGGGSTSSYANAVWEREGFLDRFVVDRIDTVETEADADQDDYRSTPGDSSIALSSFPGLQRGSGACCQPHLVEVKNAIMRELNSDASVRKFGNQLLDGACCCGRSEPLSDFFAEPLAFSGHAMYAKGTGRTWVVEKPAENLDIGGMTSSLFSPFLQALHLDGGVKR